VSSLNGTGLVHNAPDFGNDDYLACAKYNIKPFSPIDNFGRYNDKIIDHDLIGVFYNDANEIIINKLCKNNSIIGEIGKIIHAVAHD
jgi:isoleucyl-tRNA synthetase